MLIRKTEGERPESQQDEWTKMNVRVDNGKTRLINDPAIQLYFYRFPRKNRTNGIINYQFQIYVNFNFLLLPLDNVHRD